MTANPVAKKAPKVDLDATREKLGRLGLVHASDRMGETLAEAAKHDWGGNRKFRLRSGAVSEYGVGLDDPQ